MKVCIRVRERLTKSDIEKIESEIEYRKLVVRKEALEDVKVARAHGDLSENFEYKAAKQFKNQNESRIRYLDRVVRTAIVISDESHEDEVGLNKTVQVLFEEDDEVEEYKLVTSIRGDSNANRISIESPLGKAIRGHRVGDRIYVEINTTTGYYVTIQSIGETNDDSDALRKF
ncbi:MAG: transcription elongation factor GreA [Eubacteriales bacterium]